jgi:arginyl-tRNA synthetase
MIKETIRAMIQLATETLFKEWGSDETIPYFLEIPQDKTHGDFSTNVAMTSARSLKKNPREIAMALVEQIQNLPHFESSILKVNVAGPGFINVTVHPQLLYQELLAILDQKNLYGRSSLGKGQKVRIEFVSANPTGPLHVGHGRGAVIGDVLSSLYEYVGYNVTREYYLNDCGNQINVLGKTTHAWARAIQEGKQPSFLTDASEDSSWYRGAYMEGVAQKLLEQGDLPKDNFDCGRLAGEIILETLQTDLENFGVKPFDLWSSEKTLHESGQVQEAIQFLKDKDLVEERDGALWFLSSRMGDEKDRVVIKSDGALTYLAADIAFHHNKFKEGYDCAIDIWGADHHGYVARVKAAIEALGHDLEKFSVVLCQLVRLMRSGEIVPMSTRAGEFVTLAQIVDEVGKDVARYFFLMRKSDAHLDFDLDIAKKQSMDNPVYYIQYAYARICSVERNVKEQGLTIRPVADIVWTGLSQSEELNLLKVMGQFQEVVESCVRHNDVHHLASYLRELSSTFHSFYRQCRVLTEDEELTQARYYLTQSVKIVLENGLDILGLSRPEAM